MGARQQAWLTGNRIVANNAEALLILTSPSRSLTQELFHFNMFWHHAVIIRATLMATPKLVELFVRRWVLEGNLTKIKLALLKSSQTGGCMEAGTEMGLNISLIIFRMYLKNMLI
jgi:hypothetical protein